MDLLWPGFLALLGLIPLIVLAYLWMLRRRRPYAARFSSLTLVRDSLPRRASLRRHVPAALFLGGLGSLVLALARPVAVVSVPTNQTLIILAMDVSRSMCASDIEPSRLESAQAAALEFIDNQKPGTRIGLVAFARFAEIIQAPTTDREALRAAILSLTTGRRTAIGSGILKSIDAIAEVDPNVAPSVTEFNPDLQVTPVPSGAYAPDIIVLLTDGANNSGVEPQEAAQQAADRGVRVYTIGFGTERGGAPICPPRLVGGELFDGGAQAGDFFGGGGFGGGGGGGFRRGIDEATLKQVAAMTGAEYYSASSAAELQQVFRGLPTYFITKHETTEITVGLTALGALLAAVAVGLSLLWQPLP